MEIKIRLEASNEMLAALNTIAGAIGALLNQNVVQNQSLNQAPVQQGGQVSTQYSQPYTNQTQMQQPVNQVPTSNVAQNYTLEQLSVAAATLMDQGKMEQLMQILNSFGVAALTQLPKEQYGLFAVKLREAGVNV